MEACPFMQVSKTSNCIEGSEGLPGRLAARTGQSEAWN
jgi:hypothetical protein